MATRIDSHRRGKREAAQPYLDILLAGGLGSHSDRARIAGQRKLDVYLPLLVHYDPAELVFEGKSPRQAFVELLWLDEDVRKAIIVPDVFSSLPESIEASSAFNYCVLLLRMPLMTRTLRSTKWDSVILQAEVGPPVLLPAAKQVGPATHPFNVRARAATSPFGPPEQVIIAVIDSGIAFMHPRFRSSTGTRIAWLWQQDLIGQGTPAMPGRELTAANIDQAYYGAVGNEDRSYRDLNCVDMSSDALKPLMRRRSHGTQVLDLAANPGRKLGTANLPLIAVDMPDESVGDPAGSTLKVHAAWALIYVLWRAQAMRDGNRTLPVTVNLSYGPHEGPHDGSDMFERILDLVVQLTAVSQTPVEIILAAGNSRQTRTHAAFELCEGTAEQLRWRLQPGSLSPSFMEIWLPPGLDAKVKVTLIRPDGSQALDVTDLKPDADVKDSSGNLLMSARYVDVGVARAHIVVGIAPTMAMPGSPGVHGVAPAGVYTVKVEYGSAQNQAQLDMHAWIKRGDTPRGRKARSRQSIFEDARYRRFDKTGKPIPFDPPSSPATISVIRRSNTLSGIATGESTTVVGGYRRDVSLPTLYTSEGGLQHSGRALPSPNWLSASDESAALDGILTAGSRTGSWVSMNGTSAAAPQTTYLLAKRWLDTGTRPTVPGLPLEPVPPGRVPPANLTPSSGNGLLPTDPRRDRP